MNKFMNVLWWVSLALVLVLSVVGSVTLFADIDLPDAVRRIIGIAELVCGGVLVFVSIRRSMNTK